MLSFFTHAPKFTDFRALRNLASVKNKLVSRFSLVG